MGCYDTVRFPCPYGCGQFVEAQSKAGDCHLRVYSLEDAPPIIVADIAAPHKHYCPSGHVVEVVVHVLAAARVVVDPERADDLPCGYCDGTGLRPH